MNECWMEGTDYRRGKLRVKQEEKREHAHGDTHAQLCKKGKAHTKEDRKKKKKKKKKKKESKEEEEKLCKWTGGGKKERKEMCL